MDGELVLNRGLAFLGHPPTPSQKRLRQTPVLGVALSGGDRNSEPRKGPPRSGVVGTSGRVLEREGARGPASLASLGAPGSGHLRSPRRAPAPPQPRPRCHSPLALTGSRRSGPAGLGLMQSARYLGRRLHYQPGPHPGAARASQPARQPAPRRPAAPRLLRSRGCAPAPRGGTWPQPAPHNLGSEAGPGRAGGQGAGHPGSRGCRTRECAPLAGPAGGAGEAQAGARRAGGPASLEACEAGEAPGEGRARARAGGAEGRAGKWHRACLRPRKRLPSARPNPVIGDRDGAAGRGTGCQVPSRICRAGGRERSPPLSSVTASPPPPLPTSVSKLSPHRRAPCPGAHAERGVPAGGELRRPGRRMAR